jgi:hypothetical protein
MSEREIATVEFTDLESGDDGLAMVRVQTGQVILSLTLKANGDLLIAMPPDRCKALVEALQRAIEAA